jgi:hypothetical protein
MDAQGQKDGVMPNRIIREGIITSVPVNTLSWGAEVFYRRLLNVADDFGRFHANTSLLRAYCYPLQLNKVSDSDIAKWLAETRKAGLVRVYRFDGKEILELDKFGQRVRAEKTKFPLPSDIGQSTDGQLSDNGETAAHVVEDVVVVDKKPSSGKPDLPPGFVRFWTAWPKSERKQGKAKCLAIWKRKKLEAQADAVVAHVEKMAASESWRTGFDPMPETYLNGDRWDGAELDAVGKTALGECQWNVNGNRDPDAGKCPHSAVGVRNNVPYCQTHLGQVH